MARIEINSFVEVMETGRVGVVIDRERTKVYVDFLDKEQMEPDEECYEGYELKQVDLTPLKTSQLRSLVRGELDLKAVSGGNNLFPSYVITDSKAYNITVEDLLAGIEVMEKKSAFSASLWIATLYQFEDEIKFACEYDYEAVDDIEEKYMLAYAYNELGLIRWLITEEEMDSQEMLFVPIKDTLKRWITSGKHEHSKEFCEKMTEDYDSHSIDQESQKVQEMFKRCLDQLCELGEAEAIQKRGYCYYCGTQIYPQDWFKARDSFETYYKMTGDASAANTLGYIYYYGRCNKRVPEYEKAFYYFSIGHAYGYYESTYKLADMFHHGYGVVKSDETAERLYWTVYNENYQRFIQGDFACKFADAALRIGNCYRRGIGVTEDNARAYQYYLQADLAIRKRMEVANHYGDQTVFLNIQKALEETRPEGMIDLDQHISVFPMSLNYLGTKEYHKKIKVRECEDGTYALTFSLLPRMEGEKPEYIFVSDYKIDCCKLVRKVYMQTAPGSDVTGMDENNEIIFDDFSYDFVEKKTIFYMGGNIVGSITSENYKMLY